MRHPDTGTALVSSSSVEPYEAASAEAGIPHSRYGVAVDLGRKSEETANDMDLVTTCSPVVGYCHWRHACCIYTERRTLSN